MNVLRPNDKRAKAAIMFIWIVLLFDAVSILSDYFEYQLIKSAYNGFYVTVEEAESNDTRQIIIGLFQLVFSIISGITFIKWFRRACFNLQLKVKTLSFKESWAASSWFIPLVNLYRPYKIMKELHIETNNLINAGESSLESAKSISTRLLGFWWFLWILSGFVGQFAMRIAFNSETLEDYLTSSIASIITSIVGIILAFITVKIIKDYSVLEDKLIEDQLAVDNN